MRGLEVAVAYSAAQYEDLALGGFEGLPQLVDLVLVLLFECGDLGGQGAHDAAGGVPVGRGRCRWRGVVLLGPQVFDALADRGAAVEEVWGDAGALGQAAEGDRVVAADQVPSWLSGMASVRAATPPPRMAWTALLPVAQNEDVDVTEDEDVRA